MPLSCIRMAMLLIKRHIIITTSRNKNGKNLQLSKTSSHHCFILLKNQKVMQICLKVGVKHPIEYYRKSCLYQRRFQITLKALKNKLKIVILMIIQVSKTRLQRHGIKPRTTTSKQMLLSHGLPLWFFIPALNSSTLIITRRIRLDLYLLPRQS